MQRYNKHCLQYRWWDNNVQIYNTEIQHAKIQQTRSKVQTCEHLLSLRCLLHTPPWHGDLGKTTHALQINHTLQINQVLHINHAPNSMPPPPPKQQKNPIPMCRISLSETRILEKQNHSASTVTELGTTGCSFKNIYDYGVDVNRWWPPVSFLDWEVTSCDRVVCWPRFILLDF